MKSLFSLFLITTLFFISCNDDDATPTVVQLPPITSEGLNNLGFFLNGKPWVAKTNNSEDEVDAIYNSFLNEFQVHANLITSSKDEFLIFATDNFIGVGEYNLVPVGDVFIDFKRSKAYELDTSKVRRLFIEKFETEEKVVSGTFEFTVFRGEDTLKITEGRFDAKYRD